MERNDAQELIDLGAASSATKGFGGMIPDFADGQDRHGLSND